MRHLRQGFFSVFPNFYKNSFLMITIPIEFARLIWRMLLANSSVREAAKTARVCQYATRPWRLPYTRSSSKIITPNREPLVFSERTPEACTNLSCGRFVLCGEQTTVDSRVCRIRFDPLFRLRHVFSSKIIAPNREPRGFFRTNSGSVCEPLMWEVRFVWGTDNG